MENSKAYNYLIDQINATGARKLSGYYPKITEEIYDWERSEVEVIIWDTFNKKNDTDLAVFLPKLRNYDGISALKTSLSKWNIPSGNSLNIARALYEATEDPIYLIVFKRNLELSNDKRPIVAMLSYCKPGVALYSLLSDIYVNEEDSIIRGSAVMGLLHCRGYICDPYNMQEVISKIELEKMFDKEDKEERIQMLKVLERGGIESKYS